MAAPRCWWKLPDSQLHKYILLDAKRKVNNEYRWFSISENDLKGELLFYYEVVCCQPWTGSDMRMTAYSDWRSEDVWGLGAKRWISANSFRMWNCYSWISSGLLLSETWICILLANLDFMSHHPVHLQPPYLGIPPGLLFMLFCRDLKGFVRL